VVGREHEVVIGAEHRSLYGAHLEQLPTIWKELVDAGFESGSGHGKALRNVKSCIGSSWCRFGVQDSVALAVDLENRSRGLRSPHKFKSGVSGCSRECAGGRGRAHVRARTRTDPPGHPRGVARSEVGEEHKVLMSGAKIPVGQPS